MCWAMMRIRIEPTHKENEGSLIEDNIKSERQSKSLTDHLRKIFKLPLEAAGSWVHAIGIHPNWITVAGLVGSLAGSWFVSQSQFSIGGIIILGTGLFDALDGAVARAGGVVTRFGAFFDSVIDRYSELVLFAALAWSFHTEGTSLGLIASIFALAGSLMVSYTRARGEGIGISVSEGLMTRVERVAVIGLSLLFRQPLYGVIIVAILANLTALQRMTLVRKATQESQ
jgi:CDP-diacylglycerol---glycerol-3-phosphate 3-phosphatidyltransferase